MGKHGKKHRESHHRASRRHHPDADEDYSSALASSAFDLPPPPEDDNEEEEEDEVEEEQSSDKMKHDLEADSPSKFHLYQLSVQSPKGDISYMLNFFLTFVGGRQPLHLQEDFCGTALLSTEWLRSDPRRTAVGLDLDLESLNWCLDNNSSKAGSDAFSRLSLFHGNVLYPFESRLVNKLPKDDLVKDLTLTDSFDAQARSVISTNMRELPARDIVCAFNYSCCCLHSRKDLVSYFRHALSNLSRKGGIFVMDLYGGTSSECKLRLKRKFSGFTYIWEQEEFDVIKRTTRISLHFQFGKKKTMWHAFSYHWRLWSLPEIKDSMEEAGFKSVHFWMREMPDTQTHGNADEFSVGRDVKYKELSSFHQRDAWNAYVVAVANV